MASKALPAPRPLMLEGNLATNWKQFIRDWTNYEIATGLEEADDRKRTATFLSIIGREAMNVYDGFSFEQDRTFALVVEKFESFCIGRTNECYERFIFNSRQQQTNETFEKYLAELRKLIKTCEYGQLEDSLLRDKIIIGIRDEETKKRLLQTQNLDLRRTIDICRTNESAAQQLSNFSKEDQSVHKVKTRHGRHEERRQGLDRSAKSKITQNWVTNCKFCGKDHAKRKEKCFAWGKTCAKCKKRNHFHQKCTARLHQVTRDCPSSSESDSDKEYHLLKVGSKAVTASLIINLKKVRFQVDTGADINTISRKHVYTQQLKPTTRDLVMWNGTRVKPLGQAILRTKNPKNGKTYDVLYIVVDDQSESRVNLLGLETLQEMEIIEIKHKNFIAQVQQGQNVETIGNIGTASLTTDPDVAPRTLPCRSVPIALKNKVKAELTALCARGILEPVQKPTSWVSQMAVVEKKNGAVRICIDPQPLNKALRREHYKLPTLDDVLPKLQRSCIFSKLDVREAFYHVKLDEKSAELTTMITPFGRYKWKRLPFGLCVSSEIFQRHLNETLEGLQGCINVADDIIVHGKSEMEHDRNMKELISRCKERNVQLNDEKACLKKKELEFLGHIIGQNGVKPDPNKVKAILEMPEPNDAAGVRRFCGIIQYLARFIPNLSTTAEPLRSLTRKNAEFRWGKECEESFAELKRKVAEATTLNYFDENKPLSIQVDSSIDGIGAVLLQDGKPIEFASRALTDTQQKWAQIEKETLAVVFGLERFHQYTYGRLVTVENDHKPLEVILNRPLSQAPKRLQNLMMRINRYHISFKFVPGSELKLADALSRATLREAQEIEENYINCIEIRDVLQERIRCETAKDVTFAEMATYVKYGWPDIRTLKPELKPYHNIQECVVLDNGLLLKGERVIIPTAMRREIKDRLHSAHLGHDSMIRRARQTVYWPGIDKELKQIADGCDACQRHKPLNRKEPLQQHDEGNAPWQKIGIDFFEFEDRQYLIIVDYYSNFIEVENMQSTKTTQVINKLKQQFARYGVPQEIVSDNGPQFSSETFSKFTEDWDILHKTSSPGHPQSNGKAEAGVKAIKRLMKRAHDAHSDPYKGLLEMRNTPRQDTGMSPAQLVFNRQTRSLVPSLNKPSNNSFSNFKQKRDKRQRSVKAHHDKTAQKLPHMAKGQPVFYKPLNSKTWQKGKITDKNDRSYQIQGDNGGIYRRNRRYINPSFGPPTWPSTARTNIYEPDDDYYNQAEPATAQQGNPQPFSQQPATRKGQQHPGDHPTEQRQPSGADPVAGKGQQHPGHNAAVMRQPHGADHSPTKWSQRPRAGGCRHTESTARSERPRRGVRPPNWLKDYVAK